MLEKKFIAQRRNIGMSPVVLDWNPRHQYELMFSFTMSIERYCRTHAFSSSVHLESQETVTSQWQWAHLRPRSWFLNPVFQCKKSQSSLGKWLILGKNTRWSWSTFPCQNKEVLKKNNGGVVSRSSQWLYNMNSKMKMKSPKFGLQPIV
jgi:hypothetical protein